jgi:hypothetical protein
VGQVWPCLFAVLSFSASLFPYLQWRSSHLLPGRACPFLWAAAEITVRLGMKSRKE